MAYDVFTAVRYGIACNNTRQQTYVNINTVR